MRVKEKGFVRVFLFIHKKCPWFSIGSPIGAKPFISCQTWQKVGGEINMILLEEGIQDETASRIIFSYWGLIKDIIEVADNHPSCKHLLSVANQDLKAHSPSSVHPVPTVDRSCQVFPCSDIPSLAPSAKIYPY